MQNILVEPSQWGSARIVASTADRSDHLIISQESAVPPREMSRTNRPYLRQMADNPKTKCPQNLDFVAYWPRYGCF